MLIETGSIHPASVQSSELNQYISSEFPLDHGIIFRDLRALQQIQRKDQIYALGEKYHKVVYSRAAGLTGKFTDSFDGPLTDIFLPFALYGKEPLILYLGYNILSQVSQKPVEGSISTAIALGLGSGTTVGITGSLYFFNYLRKPIQEKIGLQEKEFNPKDEVRFVISELNKRKDVPTLEYDELVPTVYKAVQEFTVKHDGYAIDTATKAKKSRFSRIMLNKARAIGLLNPFIHEVVIFTDYYPEAIAHEFAHLQGIPVETQAQLVGVLAQIESGHPYLEYLGYREWLTMLLSLHQKEWVKDEKDPEKATAILKERLEQMGLPQRIYNELLERAGYAIEIESQYLGISWLVNKIGSSIYHLSPEDLKTIWTKIGKKTPPHVMYLLKYPDRIVDEATRNMMLHLLGQESIERAYFTKPLALLHDYRLKKAEGEVE